MKNTQVWRGSPTWHPILLESDDEKLRAYADPEVRKQLHEEMSKCEAGMRSCDQHVIDRLQAQCQRDEKRLPQVPGPRDGGRP